MTTPQTPAGWYSDPDGSGGQRYWDGQAWTEHQTPAPQAPQPPSTPPEPPSAAGRVGAHRAPENRPESPAQPTSPVRFEAATDSPMSPPSPPTGAGGADKQLLMRYVAVCAALLAMLVAVVVFAAFFADEGSMEVGAFEDPTTTISPTTTPGGARDATPTDTATATPTLPESGDYVDGPLAFTVNAVEITSSVASAEFPVDKTAAGEFVVVHLAVTNTGDEPATFLGNFQKLMADGAVYSIDDEATFYTGGALAELNPGDEVDLAVVFDVPLGTDPEAIELHSDPLSPGVEVSLP